MVNCLRFLLALVLSLVSASSFAGYYVVVTSSGNTSLFRVGLTSTCQTSISSAVSALAPYSWTITNFYSNYTVVAANAASVNIMASVYNCDNASAGEYPNAALSSGLVDPSLSATVTYSQIMAALNSLQNTVSNQAGIISQLQVNGTSSGSTSSSDIASMKSDIQYLKNQLNLLTEPFDLTSALAAFAFFFSTTIFFYGVSRGAGSILEVIRRPLGRG